MFENMPLPNTKNVFFHVYQEKISENTRLFLKRLNEVKGVEKLHIMNHIQKEIKF